MTRGRALLAVCALVLAGVGAGAVIVLGGGGSSDEAAAEDDSASEAAEPATAAVERRDLVRTEEIEGELRFEGLREFGSRLSGTVTSLPEADDRLGRGDELFRVDDVPVVLLLGDVPAWREMRWGTEGADVEQLQDNLRELGYGDDDLETDGEFGPSTRDAVRDWQDDLGADDDGVVALGAVRFEPESMVVRGVEAALGDTAGDGTPVLTVSGEEPVVRAQLSMRERDWLDEGDQVTVVLPDGEERDGTVSALESVVRPGSEAAGESAEAAIDADIELSSAEDLEWAEQVPVDIRLVRERIEGALVVPVHALLALAEGGFAVEVIGGDGSEGLVAVETGAHHDGVVEIDGSVEEGDRVVIPE